MEWKKHGERWWMAQECIGPNAWLALFKRDDGIDNEPWAWIYVFEQRWTHAGHQHPKEKYIFSDEAPLEYKSVEYAMREKYKSP